MQDRRRYKDVTGASQVAKNVRFAAGNVAVARHRNVRRSARTPGPKHYYRQEWTCPLNGQIESGIDRYVGRIVYPDWYVESIVMWAGSFILIGMWNRLICGFVRFPDW